MVPCEDTEWSRQAASSEDPNENASGVNALPNCEEDVRMSRDVHQWFRKIMPLEQMLSLSWVGIAEKRALPIEKTALSSPVPCRVVPNCGSSRRWSSAVRSRTCTYHVDIGCRTVRCLARIGGASNV